MTELRELHLYGDMAERFGRVHPVAAPTIGDAIRIVDCNYPGFALSMRRRNFHVARGPGRFSFTPEELSYGESKAREVLPHQLAVPAATGDWHLIPVMSGGKSGTFKTILTVVVGGALLATGIGGALGAGAFAAGGASTATAFATTTGFLGLSYGTVALMGASLFLSGINQLLSPTQTTDTSAKKPTSFSFDGPGEVDDEGGPIPIIIGEVLTGPVRIAAAITSSAVANGTRNGNGQHPKEPGNYGGGGGGGRYDFYVDQQ